MIPLRTLVLLLPLLVSALALAKPPPKSKGPKVIECGKDLDCLAKAAADCAPARATHEVNIDFMGMEQRTVDQYEIKGWDGRHCRVLQTRLEASARIGPRFQKAARARGMSNAEIARAQADGDKEKAAEVGMWRECKAPPKSLQSAFRRWKKGQYQSDDLGECGQLTKK